MTQPVLKADRLSYRYGETEHHALRDISFEIFPGEYVAIVGPNGAGKTTLCLTMIGIVPHMTSGEMEGWMLVDGIDTWDVAIRELGQTVGIVFDNPEYQLSQATAREEIALGLENAAVPRDEMLRRIAEVLEIVELTGLEYRSPLALSGGQQQRLAIAATLANYPSVLVLDEPTSNLDPVGKEDVFSTCRKLNEERGMTVIIAEHEVETIALYADRVFVMDKGRIILQGTPREVLAHVDTLSGIGVNVPQVTDLTDRLAGEGLWEGDYPVVLDKASEMMRQRLS